MSNKFSDHALNAIKQAPIISASMGHTYTGTEHLLLAFLSREECVAAKILSNSGLDYPKARLTVMSLIGIGTPTPNDHNNTITQNFRHVLKQASDTTPKAIGTVTTQTILEQMLANEKCGAFAVMRAHDIEMSKIKRLPESEKSELLSCHNVRLEPLPQNLVGITTDLNALAQSQDIEDVICRDEEIKTVFLILSRKQKNAPCLLGAAGVGKTAIARSVALRIVKGECPKSLQDKRILVLDTSALLAGTKYRGDVEERIKNIVKYCENHPNIILFIDEIHTIVGAGSAEGSLDAANMLKPALSLGQLRIIGATTQDEYEKFIKKDPALERRFCPILVKEPSSMQTQSILSGVAKKFEAFHKVSLGENTVSLCVYLSGRCLPQRHFPDKAIDVLDLACALCAGEHEKKQEVTSSHVARAISYLVSSDVNENGLPIKLCDNSILKALQSDLFGQSRATNEIYRQMAATTHAKRNSRPICSLLFCGDHGVGKSFCAQIIARAIYPDSALSERLVRIDMSKFSSEHNLTELTGAPAGYVGHEKGSKIIKAIKKQPFCLVLLENVEKAHPDAINIITQILSDGTLQGSCDMADMKNCILIMTANVCKLNQNIGFKESGDIRSHVEKILPSETLSMLDGVVNFDQLTYEAAIQIAQRHLGSLFEDSGLSCGISTYDLAKETVDSLNQEKFAANEIIRKANTIFAQTFKTQ